MNYGYFDDTAREYVITRPDTPRPWSNYLGSRRYGGIITNNAGGYSFTRSPAEGRVLRMRFNGVPLDQPGRYFYIRDRDRSDYWSASWQPVGKPLDHYKSTCRFGTAYAILTSEYAGILAETTYFVPLDQEFEYWWLRLRNTGSTLRRLSVFSFCEFPSEWNMQNDLMNIQYTAYIAEATWRDGMIAAASCGRLPEDPEDFANRDQSRHWYLAQVGGRITGYDLDREAFIGVYHGFHNPQAVERGACSASVGYADNICGAIQSDVELAPGESCDVLVLLGVGRADTVGVRTVREYGSPTRAQAELERLRKHWHRLLGTMRVESPDPDFDHMVNVWNTYNALMTFDWSRSCSLVYTGDQRDGFGFRDTVQDILGVLPVLPERCRERLELMLTGQESTGGARPEIKPWLHKPGKMPLTPPHKYRSDDCLWFFNVVPAYIAETGDVSFYDKVLPYADTGEATVLGHLRRALEFNLERTGRNGLPCGLEADWNDCLKLGYHGESVFVAFQVRLGLTVYADIAARLGRDAERDWALRQREILDERIRSVCWDGAWFIWAIAEDGTVYGTKNYPEGQVYLNTQVWAVISGAATPEQTEKALETVRTRLATDYGLMLCDPPFRNTPVAVMRAVLMNPGCKENGGIFSHTQSWAVIAECLRGDGDRAYSYYRAFLPAAQNKRADIRQIEPYVHCQSTHGTPSPKYGTSRIPWLSGTATWSCYTATHWILGVRPEIDGLRVDPCIPSSWPEVRFQRLFRGMTLHVTIRNPEAKCKGVRELRVDGKVVPPGVIPLAALRDGAQIEAVLG